MIQSMQNVMKQKMFLKKLYLSQDSGIIIRKIKNFDLLQNIDTDFPRRCIPVKCDKLQNETVPFRTKDDAAF